MSSRGEFHDQRNLGCIVAGHRKAGFEDRCHSPQPQDNGTKILRVAGPLGMTPLLDSTTYHSRQSRGGHAQRAVRREFAITDSQISGKPSEPGKDGKFKVVGYLSQ